MYAMEKELLSAALKFHEGQNIFDQEEIWNELKIKFEAAEVSEPNYSGNEFFNFSAWAESKVSRTAFETIVQNQQQKIVSERA